MAKKKKKKNSQQNTKKTTEPKLSKAELESLRKSDETRSVTSFAAIGATIGGLIGFVLVLVLPFERIDFLVIMGMLIGAGLATMYYNKYKKK